MESIFRQLRGLLGSHKAVAEFLGMSYTRYNEWRRRPAEIPAQGRKLLELALFKLEYSRPEAKRPRCSKSDDSRHFIAERKS